VKGKTYFQVYTGNGKGKSTASFGLALRALGAGLKVYIGQFMKGSFYSELNSFKKFENLKLEQYGFSSCLRKEDFKKGHFTQAKKNLDRAKKILLEKKYDLVILDEINVTLHMGLLQLEDVISIIDNRPSCCELVFTGRYAHKEIIEKADLVTQMKEIKHYYNKGVQARVGIEK